MRRTSKKIVNLTEEQATRRANELVAQGYSVTIKESSSGLWDLYAHASEWPKINKFYRK